MTTKAIPLSAGIWVKNFSIALKAPADPPIQMIGNALLFAGLEAPVAFEVVIEDLPVERFFMAI
jgi:hypothetical protein